MGRVGSSHINGMLGAAGLKTIFEPLGGTVEGARLLRDDLLAARARCIYDCRTACKGRTRLGRDAAEAVALLCDERTHAVKTTRLLDLGALASALAPRHLRATNFALLLCGRTPRRASRNDWSI